jgi:RNA polymerase sigma-70 factor (ECF subfamily)
VDIARVLARIAEGDREAFAEVVEVFQRPLFRFLGRMGLTHAVAAEIAQETFVRAWRNLGQYQSDRAEFSTWLFSIARNLALNELTRMPVSRQSLVENAVANVVSALPTPVDEIAQQQSSTRLQLALSRLPLADRTALALVYVQELQLADVAELEGTTVGAIKTRVHRAKAKLRELLGAEHE